MGQAPRGAAAARAGAPARLKEWVYAGFAFDLAAAIAAHLSVGDGPESVGMAGGDGSALRCCPTFLWRRLQAAPASAS